MQFNLKNIVAASLLIIALSFAYYFVIFLPNKHKTEQELEKEKFNAELRYKKDREEIREDNFSSCLDTAHKNLTNNWDIRCNSLNKENDCTLPNWSSEDINESYNNEQELCIKKYK